MKKIIKRSIALLLVVLTIAFALVGCSSKAPADTQINFVIVSCVGAEPFESGDSTSATGFNAELISAIAENQGFNYSFYIEDEAEAIKSCQAGQVNAILTTSSAIDKLEDSSWIRSDVYYTGEGEEITNCILSSYNFTDEDIISLFNTGLNNIKANGTYDEIYNKYFA